MATEPRKFDYWWKGAPLVQDANTGSFGFWWKGAPVLQKAPTLNTYTVVGSGGISVRGAAPFKVNLKAQASGGVTVGGAASANRDFVLVGSGGITVGGASPVAVNFNTRPVGVVVGAYVGDGTGARSIVATGYTPISVMVMGRDGSGHETGAMRIRGDGAGKSHPWAEDVAAGDSSRDNHITAFNANGFDVGSALNASGVPYVFVAFPEIEGFIEAGSYVGSGRTGEVNAFITTVLVSGTFTSGSGIFSAGDVGRRMFRTSDRTLIGTISHVTDSQHADGVVVQALTGSNDWYWEPRVVPLGLFPNLVVLQCTDTTGTTRGPLPIVPSIDRLGGATIPNGSVTTNIDFAGNGINPGLAAVVDGTSDLLVLNSGASYPESTGYDGDGKTYLWLAVKTDESKTVPTFEKILYTGDGTAPRDLTPVDFAPTFAMIFAGDLQAPGFRDAAGAVASNSDKAMPFQDGVGDLGSKWSFLSNGIHLEDSGFNVNAKEYAAFFMRGVLAGLGGVTVGGTSPSYHVVGSIIGSGGIKVGGAASVVESFVWTPSGGITAGGSSPFDVRFSWRTAGGVTTGGAADCHLAHSVIGSGGVVIGGSADLVAAFVWTPSGGVVVGGTSPADVVREHLAAGGVVVGGAADIVAAFVWTASGGVVVGGQAEVLTNTPVTYVVQASGGVTVGGAAVVAVVLVVAAEGGVTAGGQAFYDVRYSPPASGGVFVTGNAGVRFVPGAPPVPPVRPTATGGADLVRQPFWGAPGTRVRAEVVQQVARLDVAASCVEDELASEENQLLGLL